MEPSAPGEKKKPRLIEVVFERALWSTRFIVLIPVLFSFVGSLLLIAMGSLDVIHVVEVSVGYLAGQTHDIDLHTEVIIKIVGAIDTYLIAIVLLIFTFGMYTLFISEIDHATDSEAAKILDIHSLDSLKDKLSQVVIMALIVKFFQIVISMSPSYTTPLDMIYLSASILGLGACLLFLYRAKSHAAKK